METVHTPAAAAASDLTIGMDDDCVVLLADEPTAVTVACCEAKADASEEGSEALLRRSNERKGPTDLQRLTGWWVASVNIIRGD